MVNKFVSDCVNLYLSWSDIKEIAKVYSNGQLNEQLIQQFEENFASYIGTRYAIALSCARLGLYLTLGYIRSIYPDKQNPEIILSAYNFFAIPDIIKLCGFIPHYIDAEYKSCNIDSSQIEKSISGQTAAILVTHTYGNPCYMSKITQIARRHNLFLIEDCAHALGAEFGGRRVGGEGLSAFFSLSLSKIITTFSGGMLTTNNYNLYEYAKRQISAVESKDYIKFSSKAVFASLAYFFSSPTVFDKVTFYPWYVLNQYFSGIKDMVITEKPGTINTEILKKIYMPIQALIGNLQLPKIGGILTRRIKNSAILTEELKNIPSISCVSNEFAQDHKNIYLNFAIKVTNRDEIQRRLLKLGIDSRKGYLINCANIINKSNNYFNCAGKLEKEVLFLPNHNKFEPQEIKFLADKLKNFFCRIN